MRRRLWLRVTTGAVVGTAIAESLGRSGVGAAASPDAMAEDLLTSWRDVVRKLVDMAEDFPEDKYDWRPAPEVRSFAEQLVHAAGFVKFVAANAERRAPPAAEPRRG